MRYPQDRGDAPWLSVEMFSSSIERYLAACVNEYDRSHHTIRAYRSDLAQLLQFVSSSCQIGRFDRHAVQSWIANLGASGLMATSRIRKLAAIRSFVTYCELKEILPLDTLRGLRVQAAPSRQVPRCLSDSEVRALLSGTRMASGRCPTQRRRITRTVTDCRDRALIELMLATGVRVGEATSIRVADVSVAGQRALIRGKGRRERVAVVSDDEAWAAFMHFVGHRRQLDAEHEFVFIGRGLRPLGTRGAAAALDRRARQAGISRRITPHMLRHTAATLLLRSGADLRVVQEFLGHATVSMTQRYTHVTALHLEASLRAHPFLAGLRVTPRA
jgi:integrase/recombinase XerD